MKKQAHCITLLFVSFAYCLVAENKKDLSMLTHINNSQKSISETINQSVRTFDARIGVVEAYAAMGDSTSGLEERGSMESKNHDAHALIQEEAKKIEKAKAEYAKKAPAMTESARKSEELKIAKMERDLNDLAQEKGEELKNDMHTATERLVKELDVAVAELAQEEGLDIVVDKISGRILYVSDTFDYTEKAIDKINKRHELKLVENKKIENKNGETTKVVVTENKSVTPSPAKAKIT